MSAPSTSRESAAPVQGVIRQHAEQAFRHELSALRDRDTRPKPAGWSMSPWGVRTYLVGGMLDDGTEISPKYIGDARIIEIAIATLATSRALLLQGVPGTGKSWVSEHLSAAISGDSTLLVQGTAGMDESALRYGWNYARLLADGPSRDAMVPSPVMRAMGAGKIARIEELTRIPSDVQDALITLLSEKTLPVSELGEEVQAVPGFNVIATANDRDKGVSELSSALLRRFNTVVLPTPATLEEEVRIVQQRVGAMHRAMEMPTEAPALEQIQRVVTVFRELRRGLTEDGQTKLKQPSGTLSTAEAIAVVEAGLVMSASFGDGKLSAEYLASALTGSVLRDPEQDQVPWSEYLKSVVRERAEWKDLYRACKRAL